MWIVRLALRNPYSVAVFCIMILILGVISLKTMLVDVFPEVDLPVVAVIWSYPGLTPEEVESRITTVCERAFSSSVGGVQRIESTSLPGVSNIRVYFEPKTQIGSAVAQLAATSQAVLRVLPPGITPPNILPFNASNLPVAQITASSESLSEEQLFDYSAFFARLKLFTIPGLSTPAPYGGRSREINVDVDLAKLNSRGISPQDIVTAVQAQNVIIPAGDARLGTIDYSIRTNSNPQYVDDFKRLPVKVVYGRPIELGEVANVADAYADQTNIVRINGKRATYLNILKKSDASTLDVVDAARKMLPEIIAEAPKGYKAEIDFDQSKTVRASIEGVFEEALIASALVATMVLVFLGSWRSVIIVCTSIPLSILVGVLGLKLTGGTINIMTLGGLSLAIGMLVDDATVEVENINRNIPLAKSVTVAILTGASQIALPAIVSTLAICIVFSPIVALTGPARFLFIPMAESVVFSMLASYVLSRTLVPVLARILLGQGENDEREKRSRLKGGAFSRFSEGYNKRRESIEERAKKIYGGILELFLARQFLVVGLMVALFAISALVPIFLIGRDFFPTVDAGMMKLHFRAPTGTRLEETENIVNSVEKHIRKIVPEDELKTLNSNIGVPTFYNLAYVSSDNVGQMDAEILVALNEHHHPVEEYMRRIRDDLRDNFPGSVAYFQSADIVNQVLNFGLTSPIDIQVTAKDIQAARTVALNLRDQVRMIPGAADVVIKQTFDYPTLQFNVDRLRASEVGLTEQDIVSNMLISLSTSFTTSPSFYIDPKTGVQYTVAVKVPLSEIRSARDLTRLPITPRGAGGGVQPASLTVPFGASSPQNASLSDLKMPLAPSNTLGNLVEIENLTTMSEVSHYNIDRVLNISANVDGRDLGGVVGDIKKKIDGLMLPPNMKVTVHGQNEVMDESFTKLGLGIVLAVALVYLLMVMLFQSWLDPFIIMAAIPGALIGVVWMLAITRTTINVPSLMGTIMAIGIAVSNSNLLINFANEQREEKNLSADEAILEAGKTRLRPIFMTAFAMILGMLPMSLGLGQGGEQNAPLGRAVIGGLLMATIVTLLFVPIVYSLLRRNIPAKFEFQRKYQEEERAFDAQEGENAESSASGGRHERHVEARA